MKRRSRKKAKWRRKRNDRRGSGPVDNGCVEQRLQNNRNMNSNIPETVFRRTSGDCVARSQTATAPRANPPAMRAWPSVGAQSRQRHWPRTPAASASVEDDSVITSVVWRGRRSRKRSEGKRERGETEGNVGFGSRTATASEKREAGI